jgi:hypothetical protein
MVPACGQWARSRSLSTGADLQVGGLPPQNSDPNSATLLHQKSSKNSVFPRPSESAAAFENFHKKPIFADTYLPAFSSITIWAEGSRDRPCEFRLRICPKPGGICCNGGRAFARLLPVSHARHATTPSALKLRVLTGRQNTKRRFRLVRLYCSELGALGRVAVRQDFDEGCVERRGDGAQSQHGRIVAAPLNPSDDVGMNLCAMSEHCLGETK